MDQYRKEQEKKDIEFRDTNRKLVHDYSNQLDAKAREFHQKFVEQEDKHSSEIRQRIEEMKQTESKLIREMEELRKLKDKNIIDLEDTLEKKRVSYEVNIDSLKITIRDLEASN